MENIFIGLIAGVAIVGFIALITANIRLTFLITEMSTIIKTMYVAINKIEQMTQATMQASEDFVDALHKVAEEQDQRMQMPPTGFFKVFKSEDGRHSASSFEELIKKMRNDPNYTKMSDKDIEELRRLFEENGRDEDEDDNNEPWKK